MKFSSKSSDRFLSAFNFSSLTDIVMLLLIFFLLTSSFVTTQGLDVVLPEASESEPEQQARLNVSINEERQITVNSTEVSKETLGGAIRQEIGSDTAQTVVLRIDESIPHGEVIELLDIVKAAGGRKFFLATDRKEQ